MRTSEKIGLAASIVGILGGEPKIADAKPHTGKPKIEQSYGKRHKKRVDKSQKEIGAEVPAQGLDVVTSIALRATTDRWRAAGIIVDIPAWEKICKQGKKGCEGDVKISWTDVESGKAQTMIFSIEAPDMMDFLSQLARGVSDLNIHAQKPK